MKWITTATERAANRYEIEYDPLVGFYLYVYENDICVRDFLQDSLEIVMDIALEDFEVPKDSWKKV